MKHAKMSNPMLQGVWDAMTTAERSAVRAAHAPVAKFNPDFPLEVVVEVWWWQSNAPLGKEGDVAVCAVTGARFKSQGLLAPRLWKLDPSAGWERGNVILVSSLVFQAMKSTRLLFAGAAEHTRAALLELSRDRTVRDPRDPLGHNQHIKLDTP